MLSCGRPSTLILNEDSMSHTARQLRTVIKLALAGVPPETRQRCAAKRPRVSWQDHDLAQAEMAEAMATAVERHFVITEQTFGRGLAPAPTNASAMLPGVRPSTAEQ